MTAYVIAGNYAQFVDWCRKNDRRLGIDTDAVYVSRPSAIRGRTQGRFVLYGTYMLRSDIKEIMELAHAYGIDLEHEDDQTHLQRKPSRLERKSIW